MRLLVLLLIATLAGCGMMDRKGVAEYELSPVVVDGETICCAIKVYNTKDIGLVSVEMEKVGNDFVIDVIETSVDSSSPSQVQAEANAATAEAFKAAFELLQGATP